MSSDDREVMIAVRGLGKAYTIAPAGQRATTLAEAAVARLRRPFHRPQRETFWALQDVSFDVRRGEVVGVIGRNGAGKSTLFKVLSRITEPTTGQVELYGRVGSLLEVGTGFSGELSGRENIYLNGTILGMRRSEIARRFDEIVDFAGVEQFLDTPVKRYSSGMYVRLAFAVAAHLDSEILIVDEVLAVGDADFQRKCLNKMRAISGQGRTVLFVSHNLSTVQSLCTRAVLMSGGRVVETGGVAPIVARYQSDLIGRLNGNSLVSRTDRSGTGSVRLTDWQLEDELGRPISRVGSGQTFSVTFGFVADRPAMGRSTVDVGLSLGDGDHDLLTVLYASYVGVEFTGLPDRGRFRCTLDRLPLGAGNYRLGARVLVDGIEADWPRDGVGQLPVDAGDFFGTGNRGFGSAAPVLLRGTWRVEPLAAAGQTADLDAIEAATLAGSGVVQ